MFETNSPFFNFKFLLEFMSNTLTFKIWNQKWSKEIAHYLYHFSDQSGIKSPVMTIYQENGHQYRGRIVNGLKEDECAQLHYDSYTYTGPFVRDMRHGPNASIQSLSGNYIYDGPFRNDKKHGHG